jgi:hypothetical protein
LLNGGAADRLSEVTLPGTRWAEKQRVFALGNETSGRELVNQGAIHLLVEVEITVMWSST